MANFTPVLTGPLEIRLPTGIAHHVLLCTVYHEIPISGRRQFLGEVRRVLKENGVRTVIDWQPRPMDMGPPLAERVAPSEVERDELHGMALAHGPDAPGRRHKGPLPGAFLR